ncbi:uncharacterized protein TNCV_3933801 [Trichonephila clavipes]|nr:uncharacterized protein TNCV_3933801 [Trichonephila clavipes]
MITNFFIPELNNHDVQELWFQDGATCHTARATIDLLKDTFGDRLISRFGPVNWPPRSCDLPPLDYFLWGYVKSLVYADKPQTLDHSEDNIRRVIADIRPQMLEKVIEKWTFRLDYIRAGRGSPMPEIIFKIHAGIKGNESRPKSATWSRVVSTGSSLDSQKSITSTYIEKCTVFTQNTKRHGESWETLAAVGPIPRHLERTEAVGRYRLTTGHDFLGVYLHWLNLAVDDAFLLCGHAWMNFGHLLQCTGLNEYATDAVVSRYWEACRHMVKKPNTGVE